MSSTINASNGTVSGLISTGDASGELQLQVNNGTPAVTLNTSGAIGVGSSPSYGTSGQVLTSSGSGSAPTWSTVEALPSQTGENGKYLTTNGTIASWGTLPSTNLATGVTGTLPTANGGTGLTTVGTNGQVLSSNGSTLTWTTPSAGAMTLISTQTASNSSALIWTGLTGYDTYVLVVDKMIISTNYANLSIQLGYGATPTYITTNSYTTAGATAQSTTFVGNNSNTTYAYFDLTVHDQLGTTSTTNAKVTLLNFLNGAAAILGQTGYIYYASGNYAVNNLAGYLSSGTYPITALKLYCPTGTLTSGKASLYGISS